MTVLTDTIRERRVTREAHFADAKQVYGVGSASALRDARALLDEDYVGSVGYLVFHTEERRGERGFSEDTERALREERLKYSDRWLRNRNGDTAWVCADKKEHNAAWAEYCKAVTAIVDRALDTESWQPRREVVSVQRDAPSGDAPAVAPVAPVADDTAPLGEPEETEAQRKYRERIANSWRK